MSNPSILRSITLTIGATVAVSSAFAVECTPPPKTVTRDYQVEFDAAAARVRAVRGPGVTIAVQTETKNLLNSIPNADRTLVELTYLFTLCTALRDDRSTAEREKGRILSEYIQAVRNPAQKTQTKAPSPKPLSSPTTQGPAREVQDQKPNISVQNNSGPTVVGNQAGRDININSEPRK